MRSVLIFTTYFLLATCFIMIDNAAMATAQPAALDYTAPGGVTFTVTAEGISRICLGERMVAQGGWYAWNAGPAWFGRGDKTLVAYSFYAPEIYRKARTEISTKTLAVLAPNHARVTHRQPSVTTTYDYEFAGEDVTISARVENNHPEAELTVPAFGGLRFSFQREPGGNPLIWHPSYLKAQQSNVFHPSLLNKIGGSYASDDRVGVGLSPLRTGLAHTLFQWDWDAWNPTTPERKANRWLTYLRYEPIPAGGARTFRMNMRVSGNRDWRHLLEPYKEHFLATFGPLRYQTDFRAVGAAYVNRNLKAIAPSNGASARRLISCCPTSRLHPKNGPINRLFPWTARNWPPFSGRLRWLTMNRAMSRWFADFPASNAPCFSCCFRCRRICGKICRRDRPRQNDACGS